MKNLIDISFVQDDKKEVCYKMALTIAGAEAIAAETPVFVAELYDNTWDDEMHKVLMYDDGHTVELFSQARVPYEKMPFVYKTFHMKNPVDILHEWSLDPKKEFLFYPHKQNEERTKEVTAKIAAGMWAAYSPQKVNEAALETNERYGRLKEAHEGIMVAIRALKYDNYTQDNVYYGKVKELSLLMEKEMDFCIQKMNLISILCDGNFELPELIGKLYRKHRGVDEKMNKETINSRTDGAEDKDSETAAETASTPEINSPELPTSGEGKSDTSPINS